MAVKRSIASNYKSRTRVGFSANQSSYGSTLAKRVSSSEDKIIDDNYGNGLISTESYLKNLNERSLRTWLTPLQLTSLKIKIRDTSLNYEDSKVQTAYKTGGQYNGQTVDDNFLYQWEANKLSGMETNNPAYQEQASKIQGLKDRAERKARSDFRIQKQLEISRMPESSVDILGQKEKLYRDLAKQAKEDGDNQQSLQFETTANNYGESYSKGKNKEAFDIKEAKASEEKRKKLLENKYGDNTNVNPANTNTSGTGTQSFGTDQSGTSAGNTIPTDLGSDLNAGLEVGAEGNKVPVTRPDEYKNSFSIFNNLKPEKVGDYFSEDDNKSIKIKEDTYNNKEKEIERAKIDMDYATEKISSAEEALKNAKTVDDQNTYRDIFKSAADDAYLWSREVDRLQAELPALKEAADEKIKDTGLKVYNRITGDLEGGLDSALNNLKHDLITGNITKEDYINKKDIVITDKSDLFKRKEQELGNVFKSQEGSVTAKNSYNNLEEERRTISKLKEFPNNGEIIMDKNGNVDLKDVSLSKSEGENGVSDFSKDYYKLGNNNIYVPVTLIKKDGSKGKPSDVTNNNLNGLKQYITIQSGNKPLTIDVKPKISGSGSSKTIVYTPDIGVLGDKNYNEKSTLLKYIQNPNTSKTELLKGFGKNLLNPKSVIQENIPLIKKGISGILSSSANLNRKAYASDVNPVSSSESLDNVPEQYHAFIIKAARENGVKPEILASLLNKESWGFQDKYVNGYHTDGSGRGIGAIDKRWHPEVSDEQAMNPEFGINFAAKELKRLQGSTGSEYNALRAYNGGESGYASGRTGYDGKRTVDQTTRDYANNIINDSAKFKVTKKVTKKDTPKQDFKSDTKGIRMIDNIAPFLKFPTRTAYAGDKASGIRSESGFTSGLRSEYGKSGIAEKTDEEKKGFRDKVLLEETSRLLGERVHVSPNRSPRVKPNNPTTPRSTEGGGGGGGSWGGDIKNKIRNELRSKTRPIVNKVQPIVNNYKPAAVRKGFQNNPTVQQAALNVSKSVQGAKNTVSNVANKAKAVVSNVTTKAKDTAKNTVNKLRSLFKK